MHTTFPPDVNCGAPTSLEGLPESSSLNQPSSTSPFAQLEGTLIPKPSGSVTRISREGYNLLAVLEDHGWSTALYNDVRVSVPQIPALNRHIHL